VLVDGVAMMSCTLLAASCEEQEIATIEGVSEHGSLAAIQKAYGDWGGAQCGYCTPGFIMTVKSLLAENPDPSEEDVRTALSSNLCRCTGYNQMYEAIRSAVAAELLPPPSQPSEKPAGRPQDSRQDAGATLPESTTIRG
jgi:carbon-monoxide dehydrogenase small subunit